ncbi:glutamyl-tRNA(Gln) amidotransferase subunit B, mitochondrial [Drosophila serrata]|uniref:glutamyl-tRNA(Gln) amidotransferase subunit B, mitochondrial n=1 Tax=Drosophila serrata TaxID=7274 RepID=UPI000A1D31FF|nr:glutamyl-tRNA(Gln) amidotransferase subunit B, mitochondrial [Drosophila serrata]XP_020817462.1 glutamyl-tRNA(Gln) amidotransferase subunit B, mitochondrial [Drosophila serrata]XP_020817463.1 glutamyl-tRNA(Gln) amidotransferase subunit B, mitochondrial [Drosophila serrata]
MYYSIIRRFGTQPKLATIPKRKWRSVVGLEVHAQIASASKLFSGSGTSFGAPLNSSVAYFDASIPGTLPVLNRKCVESGIKTALALGCRVNEVSMFDRKHYFYADLPNGYQITQQRAALANNGIMTFPVITPGKKVYYKSVKLLQLQLEQDSGKSLHDEQLKRSLVDLNRAGLPLMELVFAPDLETGEEAASLVKELMLILRRLQTCSCKMEEGALRVDANISIHQEGEPLGVRTEVKNIGSVRSISQAITYEINRQLETVADGGVITNETRSWDAENRRTVAMRDKEVLQDYRFMPEPNLPPLHVNLKPGSKSTEDLLSVAALSEEIPELPEDTRQRLIEQYNLNADTSIILVNEPVLLEHFLSISRSLTQLPNKVIYNFLINDLLTYCNKLNLDVEDCSIKADDLRDILSYLHSEQINIQAARQLIELQQQNPGVKIIELIKLHNLQQICCPEAISKLCQQAIANQTKAVQQYQKGKAKALFAIVGEVGKLSNQKANMKMVVEYLEKQLKPAKK